MRLSARGGNLGVWIVACKGIFALSENLWLSHREMTVDAALMTISKNEWREMELRHRARAEAYTVETRRRRDAGIPHPVEDFLFQYYPYPFALLERWQPKLGVGLEWDDATLFPEGFSDRHYTWEDGVLFADVARLTPKELERLVWIGELLVATQERTPNFACHGLHEWAMVYGGTVVRHEKTTPLRLSQAEIDEVVRSRAISCSHYDAFRFFTSESRPMNRLQPTLDTRVALEQPGCVHANMDLYKWAAKSMPWVGAELLLDCFELALELRDLDMRASPYDLVAWGREPIRIETPEGRREYEVEQRRLATGARVLRERLIGVLEKF